MNDPDKHSNSSLNNEFVNILGNDDGLSSLMHQEDSSLLQSDSISNDTNTKPHKRKKSRKRPKSYTDRSNVRTNTYSDRDFISADPKGHQDDTFNTRSLLNNAAEAQDFNTIKEGLKFALGSDAQTSHWFPTNIDTTDHKSEVTSNDLTGHDAGSAGSTSPNNHLHAHSNYSSRNASDVAINSDSSSPLKPHHQHLNPFSNFLEVPSTPVSNRTSNFHHSTHGDLESGVATPTITVNNELPESPGKFTNIISRVSDRIAGTGSSAVSSNELSPMKSNLSLSEQHGVNSRSSLSRRSSLVLVKSRSQSSRNNLSTSINLNPESANTRPFPSAKSSVVEEFDDRTTEYNNNSQDETSSMQNPFNSTVAFENLPLADKIVPKSSKNFKMIWESDDSDLYLFGNSLKLFTPTNKVRRICYNLLDRKITNTFFLSLLCLQVVLLSYRQWNPRELNGYVFKGNNWADYLLILINIIYTVEMVAKIIAYGFYDDSAMYQELNLPFPKNDIRAKIFRGTWVTGIRQYLSLILQKGIRQKNKDPPSKDYYHDFSDSNDIELDGTYVNNEGSSSDGGGESGEGKTALSNKPVSPNQRINNKNTFLKPELPKRNVDPLKLRRAYLKNSWHRIDFISIVCFWISLFLSIHRYDVENNIMLFRALSCLRILRLCNLTRGTSTIMRSLKLAMPQLIDVVIFIGCFGLFFGIIGVQSFKSSFSRHCVWYNPDDPNEKFVNEDQYCGGYMVADGTLRPYIFANGIHSSSIKGFKCPINSRCETLENPYEGTVSFDNIFNSLELIFVIMSANTFTDLMYITMHTDSLAASLFYIFALFFMTVWLLNVFIAIIVSCFNLTRTRNLKNDSSRMQKEGIFGPISKPIQMHQDIINEAKRNNIPLKIYYKFEFLFPLAIVFDLIAQCFRSSNQSTFGSFTLYRIESAFTALFFAEIVLRFLLYIPKWRLFFKLKRNCFDLFLAVITSIIILGPVKNRLGQAYYWLTVFQIMRCYRIILISTITRDLWLKIFGNLKQLLDLTLFFFLLTFLTSIIYARFFEGSMSEEDAEEVSFNLQTLPNTFVGLYQITSTEDWTDILYNVQGYQRTLSARVFTAIFLIGWFLISNMVILSIFIAVIADTLIVPESEKKRKQLMQFIENITASIQHVDNESGVLSKYKDRFFKRKGMKEELQMAVVNLLLSGTAVNDFLTEDDLNGNQELDDLVNQLPKNKFKRYMLVHYKRLVNMFDNPFKVKLQKLGTQITDFDPTNYAKNILHERNHLIDRQNKFLKENPSYNKVFYVIGPRHKIRRFCQRIVTSSYGERIDGVEPYKRLSELFAIFMFLATIGLVVTACYITPLYRASIVDGYGSYDWTFWVDIGFLVIFSAEFAVRILADGFMFTPNAYSRSAWNRIDFIVLVSLWIETIAYIRSSGDLSRFVRGFKALRALRILTISETAKNNFHNTIITGIWKILNAAIMSLCLLIPFSIWGLNLFNGRLGYCLDGDSDFANCSNEYRAEVFDWEVLSPNIYDQPLLYFDTFGKSFSTLFEITSLEGWIDLLENLMSSTGVGTVPHEFATPINGFFIILYNFVGIVFILTLFISVIIHNYSLTTGRAYMTLDQRSWYQVKRFLLQVKPSKRSSNPSQLSPFKRFCYKMTVERNKSWNLVLNCVLFLHVIALLLEMYPTTNALVVFRNVVYLVASVLFTVNAHFLLIAQGFKVFIKYKWNLFNLLVSVGALITTIIGLFVPSESAFLNINKLFLVGTLFFVIPRSNRLSQFLRFASASLPNLLSLIFTWVVLFLVFAIALNQIFGTTKIGPNGSDDLNVRDVPKALILLFRCSFGEGWNYIMDDYKLEPPYCYSSSDLNITDCGNKQYAYILFMAWNIISMYIFLNMFISLILDSFSYIMNRGDYAKLIEREEIRRFKRTWQKFDPEGTGFIKPQDLPSLLHNLEGIFSFHLYHGELSIPELCHRWFKINNPDNLYDITVNYKEIERTVASWDIDKIRDRRKVYEHFIEEAMLNMELNREPGVSFKRILLQLPLYKVFDSSTCFNLIDFLERRLLTQKVQKRLHQNKVYETISAYICRWRYVQNKKMGRKDRNLNFDRALKRRSYLSGERSPIQQQYFDDEFDNDFGSLDLADNNSNPFDDNDKEGDEDISHESSNEENSYPKSGIYVPKSPLSTNKKGTHSPRLESDTKQSPPKLYINLPDTSTQDPNNQDSSGFAIAPQSSNSIEENRESAGLFDLSAVGETLKDSEWGEALEEFKHSSEHDRDTSEYDKNV